MRPLPEDKDKYADLLIAKTKVIRNFVILLAIVLFITVLNPDVFNTRLSTTPIAGKETNQLTAVNDSTDIIVDGIHMASGLIADEGYEVVAIQCGNCHSLKLVTQNRASRDGWKSIIEWMQETQNLWDLGEHEETILDYLAKNYAPEQGGRRKNLSNIEWYELDN